MANNEQVETLKQSVKVWNQWRQENPSVEPNLYVADLHGANLSYANLTEADLEGANLNYANLTKADLMAASNLIWEQIASAWIDEYTGLPPDISATHAGKIKTLIKKSKQHFAPPKTR